MPVHHFATVDAVSQVFRESSTTEVMSSSNWLSVKMRLFSFLQNIFELEFRESDAVLAACFLFFFLEERGTPIRLLSLAF